MLATFMVMLDTSIAVVALPYIAGNLGATQDESTWVLTSYLVANAIILPASTWFSGFFGRKRFLIGCTIIFTVASLLCGVATSLAMLVLARVLQGVGGGAMQPLSQAILLESFPPAKRGVATAVFGIGHCGCAHPRPDAGRLADGQLVLALDVLHQSARGHPRRFSDVAGWWKTRPTFAPSGSGRIDGIGFGLMALWLGTLQIILDKGQDADWFAAVWMRWFAVISVLVLDRIYRARTSAPSIRSWICAFSKTATSP